MDEQAKKDALRMIPYALYLIGVRARDPRNPATDLNAFVASWATQVSFKPPMIAIGVRRDGRSLAMIKESGVFVLNILGADQKSIAARFFKDLVVTERDMAGLPYERGEVTRAPVFPDLPAHMECKVVHVYEGENDHAVVVARIENAVHRRDTKPLTHAETGWHYGG